MCDKPTLSFFIIDYTQGGGVERVTANLSKRFIQQGYNVSHLVSLYAANETPAMQYDSTIRMEVLQPKSKSEIKAKIADFFAKVHPDVFIFQGDNMTIALIILEEAQKANVVAIAQYHGSPFAYLKKYPNAQEHLWHKRWFAALKYPFKKQKLQRFITASKHGLVCVSNGGRVELENLFGKEKTKHITTIYNPVEWFEPQKSIKKQKRVSFVSRLEKHHKNAFLIVKMWRLIADKAPDWELHIYGKGRLQPQMEAYIAKHKIRNVVFHSFVTNIYEELALSSISVSTSDCEGFPMAVLEASITRNALAVTNSDGGVKDMVIAEKTGLISPKNNAEALSKNVLLLIENETIRQQFGQAVYQHVKSLYQPDLIAQWKQLFLENIKK